MGNRTSSQHNCIGRTDRLYRGSGKTKRLKVESRIGKYKGPSVVLFLPESTEDEE